MVSFNVAQNWLFLYLKTKKTKTKKLQKTDKQKRNNSWIPDLDFTKVMWVCRQLQLGIANHVIPECNSQAKLFIRSLLTDIGEWLISSLPISIKKLTFFLGCSFGTGFWIISKLGLTVHGHRRKTCFALQRCNSHDVIPSITKTFLSIKNPKHSHLVWNRFHLLLPHL